MDLRQRVSDDRNAFQRLMGKIPGWKGYQQKEMRRDADKLLRMQIANEYDLQRQRLNEVKVALVNNGKLMAITPIERAMNKLQLFIDQLRTATYGYSGWFDAVKVDEDALDMVYLFDTDLADGVDMVARCIDGVNTALNASGDINAAANQLIQTIDSLNTRFSQRQELLVNGTRPTDANPLAALQAPAAPSAEALQLHNLKMNDGVSYGGNDFLVQGRITYASQNATWRSYQLKDADQESWLWVDPTGQNVGVLHPVDVPAGATSQQTLTVAGEVFNQVEKGTAQATVEGPSGRTDGNWLAYARFASPSGNMLIVEQWGGAIRGYVGSRALPGEIQVFSKQG